MPPAHWESHPCSTGCGRPVDIIVGSVPREPLRCDPCRAELGPRPAVHTTCDRDGCTEPVKVVGAQRRRWEMGRPVYCSAACRTAGTSWVESCGHCRTPLLGNRQRFKARYGAYYCSRGCLQAGRRLPPRACGHCREMFAPVGTGRKFCSRACAARSKRQDDGVVPVLRVCVVCRAEDYVNPKTARRYPACSLACATKAGLPGYPPARAH